MLRGDVVGGIEKRLLLAPPIGFIDRALHRIGHLVGIHDRHAVQVTRRAADRLDQRTLGAQKPFLVGIQNRDQRDFRKIQTLAQQVDADHHVEYAGTQVANDLDALNRVDVRMQVAHLDAVFGQKLGQVFRHALGQRRDQTPDDLDRCAV